MGSVRKPRKARVEGAKAAPVAAPAEEDKFAPDPPSNEPPFEEPSTYEYEAVSPDPVDEAKIPNPVPGDDGDALDRIAASFRERFPDEWDGLALCPLQHGLIEMANLMRGKG